MIYRKVFTVLIFIFLSTSAALADVPPDTGYTRVFPSLIFEARDDFPEFRFFLLTPVDIEEIKFKKGETQTIDSSGRGGPKRFLTLLAIPKSKLTPFGAGETLSDEQLKNLHQNVRDKKIDGVIELIRHGFQKDIPVAQKNNWKNPKYNLEKDSEKGIKAVETGEVGLTKNQLSTAPENSPADSAGYFKTVTPGILLSLALAALGVWGLRRRVPGN